MPQLIQRRLQVFVSSTYKDLEDIRQVAVQEIVTAGHIPAGMELFNPGDEGQMEVIRSWIDQSDVFLLIVGGRYGSIEPKSKKSYTHLELEHAVSKGKTWFSCVMHDDYLGRRAREAAGSPTEYFETANVSQFQKFKAEATGKKVTTFFESASHLQLILSRKFNELERNEALVGWVRANSAQVNPGIAEELARLSADNAKLKAMTEETTPDLGGVSAKEVLQLLEGDGLHRVLYEWIHERKDAIHTANVLMRDRQLWDQLIKLRLLTDRGTYTEAGEKLIRYLVVRGSSWISNSFRSTQPPS